MVYWKLIIVVLALQVAQISAQGFTHKNFLQWKQQHGKAYSDQTQELYRYYIYSQNLQQIYLHNSDPSHGFKLGVNQFTDLTWQEFQNIYLTLKPTNVSFKPHQKVNKDNLRQEQDEDVEKRRDDDHFVGPNDPNIYPSNASCLFNLDYSVKNSTLKNHYPFPVLDQGSCGSCYAFSALGPLGAAAAIKYNISFVGSPQQIVSCSNDDEFGNAGCNGGWFDAVYYYAYTTNISSDANYPYTSGSNGKVPKCQNKTTKRGPVKVADLIIAQGTTVAKSCTAMKLQLQKSPMAVAVSVNSKFSAYKSGVITLSACPANRINHGVYLVGVDTCGNWKIQNSWGTNWGDKGFILLKSGNTCNVCASGGYSPILA